MTSKKKTIEELQEELDAVCADRDLARAAANDAHEILEKSRKECNDAKTREDRFRKEKLQYQAEAQTLRSMLEASKRKAYEALDAMVDQANERIDLIEDGLKLLFSAKLDDKEMHSLSDFLKGKKFQKIKIASSPPESKDPA